MMLVRGRDDISEEGRDDVGGKGRVMLVGREG